MVALFLSNVPLELALQGNKFSYFRERDLSTSRARSSGELVDTRIGHRYRTSGLGSYHGIITEFAEVQYEYA